MVETKSSEIQIFTLGIEDTNLIANPEIKAIPDLSESILDIKSAIDDGDEKPQDFIKGLTDDGLGVMFYYGESEIIKSDTISKEVLYKKELLSQIILGL